jgi:hypothetical protein
MSSTPFPLGVYVGGLSTDPTTEASIEAQYAKFTSTMGAKPSFMDAFINQNAPITSWASDASYTAYSWQQSGIAGGTTPVIGLPMATSSDWGNQDSVFKAFASGAYDSQLQGIVSAWRDAGFQTQYFRVGYEANGDYVPWYAGSDPQTQSDWIAAFQHIASTIRSVPGADVKVVWNPNLQAGNTIDVKSIYPGDSSVDVIAGDMYNPTFPRDLYDWSANNGTYDSTFQQWFNDPVNRTHYWQYPAANQWNQVSDGQSNTFGMQDMINFANAHGKPIGMAETGTGGYGDRAPTDDPAFPQWLASALANSGSNVAFVNIWDTDPGNGNWDFSSSSNPTPQAAAAWGKYFGANGSATPSAAAAPTADNSTPFNYAAATPSLMILNVAQDSYNADAQFNVAIDGNQVGSTQTATALNANGDSNAVTLAAALTSGWHDLAISFLNDSWGGTAATDSNLYLKDASINGTQIQSSSLALYSDGTQHVSFFVPQT